MFLFVVGRSKPITCKESRLHKCGSPCSYKATRSQTLPLHLTLSDPNKAPKGPTYNKHNRITFPLSKYFTIQIKFQHMKLYGDSTTACLQKSLFLRDIKRQPLICFLSLYISRNFLSTKLCKIALLV